MRQWHILVGSVYPSFRWFLWWKSITFSTNSNVTHQHWKLKRQSGWYDKLFSPSRRRRIHQKKMSENQNIYHSEKKQLCCAVKVWKSGSRLRTALTWLLAIWPNKQNLGLTWQNMQSTPNILILSFFFSIFSQYRELMLKKHTPADWFSISLSPLFFLNPQ